jgi:hypothetical protein
VEYERWQASAWVQQARHSFMFRASDAIVNEPSPSSVFRLAQERTVESACCAGRGSDERAAIQGAATATPITAPMLDNTMISRMRVTGLVQKPLMLPMASGRSSRSLTLGRLKKAWTMPATQPTPMSGCSVVIGAAKNAERTVRGCAKARAAPMAAKPPVTRIQ